MRTPWRAVENGITGGISARYLRPQRRLHPGPGPSPSCGGPPAVPEPQSAETAFTDVKPGSYYEQAVAWAVENGITKGTSDTAFSPDAPCSRGQIVTFLWRSQEVPGSRNRQPPLPM